MPDVKNEASENVQVMQSLTTVISCITTKAHLKLPITTTQVFSAGNGSDETEINIDYYVAWEHDLCHAFMAGAIEADYSQRLWVTRSNCRVLNL